MRNSRENYSAETIPQLLINCKDSGCIGGDWNSIISEADATKNQAQKMSPSLKRLVKNLVTVSGRSFIKTRNNKAAITVPCGSPDMTSVNLDLTPSTTRHCFLLVKKFLNQGR